MTLWFCGNGSFAALCLQALIDQRVIPSLVICGAPRPAGRGNRLRNLPCHDAAVRAGLPLHTVGALADEGELLTRCQAECDLLLVVDFGQKVNDVWVAAPRLGALNLHPSLLPRWRGAAPVQRALMAGDDRFGVSLFYLVSRMDAGPVVAAVSWPAGDGDEAPELYQRAALEGALLVQQVLAGLDREKSLGVPQEESSATYARRIDKSETNFSGDALRDVFLRAVRALTPKPAAGLPFEGGRLAVLKACVSDLKVEPGRFYFDDAGAFFGFADGAVRLVTVVPAGRRAMSGSDWARGMREEK